LRSASISTWHLAAGDAQLSRVARLVAGNDIEVMSVHEMIELFSTEGLSKRAAIFDTKNSNG